MPLADYRDYAARSRPCRGGRLLVRWVLPHEAQQAPLVRRGRLGQGRHLQPPVAVGPEQDAAFLGLPAAGCGGRIEPLGDGVVDEQPRLHATPHAGQAGSAITSTSSTGTVAPWSTRNVRNDGLSLPAASLPSKLRFPLARDLARVLTWHAGVL